MARALIYSDLACAAGELLASVPTLLEGSELRLDQEHNDDGITLVAPPIERSAAGEWVDAPWLDHAAMMAVVRATLHSGAIHERRIARIRRGVGDAGEQVVIECYPLVVDLSNCGPIYELTAEGAPQFNLGYADLTPTQWIDSVILEFLVNRLGITYYARGTVNVSSLWSYTLDAAPPSRVLNQMATDLRARWSLRRNGDTGYFIDFIGEPTASGTAPILLRIGRNLSALESQKEIGDTMTVAIPRGGIPSGGTQAATLAESVWKLASNPLGDVIELVDPDGGPDPFMFTDQLAGKYIEKPDGTFTLVEAVTPPRYVQLADVSGLEADDLVVFRRTSAGAPLVELTHPTLILPPPVGLGRITGIVPAPELRGERNALQNAFAGIWDSGSDDVLTARVLGNHTTTDTLDLWFVSGGLVGGYSSIRTDDVLHVPSTGDLYVIEADATIQNPAGGPDVMEATITIDTAISIANNTQVLIYRVSNHPREWSSPATWPLLKVDLTRLGETPITADTVTTGSNFPYLRVDNLSASEQIGTGWIASIGGTDTYLVIGDADPSNAVGSEAGSTKAAVISPVVTGAGVQVTFSPPDFLLDQVGGTHAILLPMRNETVPAEGVGGAITPPSHVRYDAADATVHYRVGITVLAGPSGADWDPTLTDSDFFPPSLALYDETTATVLESFTDVARTGIGDAEPALGAFEALHLTLSGSHTMTQDRELTIRIAGVKETSGTVQSPFPAVFIRWAMIHVGPDADVPVTEYSHANRLWHAANTGLARLAGEQGPITVQMRDLSVAAGVTYDAITLGAEARLRNETLGLDSIRSIVKVRHSLVDEQDVEVTIDAPGQELTLSIIQSQQSQPQFHGLHTPTPPNDDPGLFLIEDGSGRLAFTMASSDHTLRLDAGGRFVASDDEGLELVPLTLSFANRRVETA